MLILVSKGDVTMKNSAINVITAILAVLLSIAFFVTALGAVVFHMLSSFTKADRITSILESIDYSAMLPDTDEAFILYLSTCCAVLNTTAPFTDDKRTSQAKSPLISILPFTVLASKLSDTFIPLISIVNRASFSRYPSCR